MICLPLCLFAKTYPLIAKLFDSEAPLVKMISLLYAPKESAIVSLTCSIFSELSLPSLWAEEGFANSSSRVLISISLRESIK